MEDAPDPGHDRFYVTGGTVPPDARSYIPRRADQELLDALTRGALCYVLNARQMGKSSLCARTRAALEAAEVRTAFLDLQKFGSSATVEQWYYSLLQRLGYDLKLRIPMLAFWRDNAERAPLDRLFGALREVALEQIAGKIVVFVDEIDVVRELGFSTDEFFAAIRACINARTDDPAYDRLTFCIIGTVAPSDLIREVRLSPFNIGTRIRLADFTLAEAAPLAEPLPGGKATLERVFWWTSGHPYLTQRLCAELTRTASSEVDAAVARLFFARADAEVDGNIKDVRNAVLRAGGERDTVDRTDLLTRYAQVVAGKRVADDDTDPVCAALRLSGLAASRDGRLYPRCRIYARIFDARWVRANLPDAELRRQRAAVARARWQLGGAAAAVVAAMASLTAWALHSRDAAQIAETRARAETAKARAATAAETKAKQDADRQRRVAQTKAEEASRESARARAALGRETVANQAAGKSAAEARRQAAAALTQKRRAQSNAEDANRIAYIANVNLVRQAMDANSYALAQQYLSDSDQRVRQSRTLKPGPERAYLNDLMHLERREFKGHTHMVTSLSLSADGKRAFTGSGDRTARLWDTATGKELRRFPAPLGFASAVALSPDGKRALVGSALGPVQLWDAATGTLRRSLIGHTGKVTSVAWAADGARALTGGEDGTARLWDTGTGKELRRVTAAGPVASAALSADGTQALLAAGGAQLWDLTTGKLLRELRSPSGGIVAVALSPDGRRALTGGKDSQARLWDTATGAELQRFSGHTESVVSVAFTPDGKSALTGSWDTTARLWDVDTGKELRKFAGHRAALEAVALSADGRYALTGGDDETARLWEVAVRREFQPLNGHTALVRAVALSPDGTVALSGSWDETARLWDTATGRELRRFTGRGRVSAAALSPDGRWVLTGNSDRNAYLYDRASGALRQTFHGHTGGIAAVAFSGDGRRILTGSVDKTARLWDTATGRELRRFTGHLQTVFAVALSRDGARAATGTGSFGEFGDNAARLWDTATGAELRRFPHQYAVFALAFCPDGRRLVTGSGNAARLWDLGSGALVREFNGHRDSLTSVAVSPDGERVVTGSDDATARLWETATGRELLPLRGHRGSVTCVGFAPDGQSVLTGGEDFSVRIWRRRTDRQVDAAAR